MTFLQKFKEMVGLTSSPETFVTFHYHKAHSIEGLLEQRLNLDKYNLGNYRLGLEIDK